MAYYAEEDDQWVDYNEYEEYEPREEHLEENLVEALDTHVQGSVNNALIKALKPFAKPLQNYGKRKFKSARTGDTSSHSSAQVLARMARNVMKDHGSMVHDTSGDSSPTPPDTSDSEVESVAAKKRSRKVKHVSKASDSQVPKNLLFNPNNIVHPRSTEWVPCPEVADYVGNNLRQGFDGGVRATLRSECPRPSLTGKVADTPDLDPTMAAFMRKFAKDPKKGLDRAWRGVQDKMLDVTGPLTKILDAAVKAKDRNVPLDVSEVLEWAQRAMCFLGNANVALSTERRRSFLMRLDSQLAEMAPSEPGSLANGMLFGDKFVKKMGKYVATFSALDKAQSNIKRVLHTGVFDRAGRPRGRGSGRGYAQTSRGADQRGRGNQRPNFYPSRDRGGRGKGQRGNYRGQQNTSGDYSYSGTTSMPVRRYGGRQTVSFSTGGDYSRTILGCYKQYKVFT
ncbi:uncharacterized protein LOC144769260 [Lissotriton helveticus]